jgi:DNA-binding CsgD family transcriptional regulator
MLVTRRHPKRPLQVVVFPFHSSSLFVETRPSTLIFLIDPDVAPARRGDLLRALYGLSPTEVRLADLLVAGLELKLAAERLRLTENTARYHLKEIFRKTGARSQSALIRLALSLPASA